MATPWPTSFLWGTGASSTQCEGAAPASDWIDWERACRAPVSGDGNGFATRYREDFAAYRDLGLTHHRLSIEWARIEPEKGRIDESAVAHYRAILEAAREHEVTPWICLHHFTLPRWFATAGGFLNPRNRTGAWLRHVERVAERFGDLAGGWKPVNEPNAYALLGWRGVGFPPGENDAVRTSKRWKRSSSRRPRPARSSGRRGFRSRRCTRWHRSSRSTTSGARARSRATSTPATGEAGSVFSETGS